MRWSIMPVWDCATGPIKQLTPTTRIIVAIFVFASCLLSLPTRAVSLLGLIITVSTWLVVTRPPARLLRSMVILGILMLSPMFLLSPFIENNGAFSLAIAAPFTLFVRGLAGLLVSVLAITALRPSELHQGLRALHVPATLATLVMQIIQQVGTVGEETRRIAATFALRGASASTSGTWHVLRAFPIVWLPRIMLRAERLALAMELRGFGIDVPVQRTSRLRTRDGLCIVCAGAWMLSMIGLRACPVLR